MNYVPNLLSSWLFKAKLANLHYFRNRKMLLEELNECVIREGGVHISSALDSSVRLFLMTPTQQMNDDKMLAFVTAIDQMQDLASRVPEAEEEGE